MGEEEAGVGIRHRRSSAGRRGGRLGERRPAESSLAEEAGSSAAKAKGNSAMCIEFPHGVVISSASQDSQTKVLLSFVIATHISHDLSTSARSKTVIISWCSGK